MISMKKEQQKNKQIGFTNHAKEQYLYDCEIKIIICGSFLVRFKQFNAVDGHD